MLNYFKWTSGLQGDVVNTFFLFLALVPILFCRQVCAILVEGIMRNNSVNLI